MRIKAIWLSWFRGAADPVPLEANNKSMVVYGENASGKSSFVDAVEYVINDGRIAHLAHEYSGRHQEKGVHNTHKPQDRKTEVKIQFKDDSELKSEINQDGSSTSSGAEAVAMRTWDYRRTVLRQGDVTDFIHDTKGVKYSALLPLLGLHEMEVAAENLRQLAKTVEQESKLRETKVSLSELKSKREATFGTDSDDQILKKVESLHAKYCANKKTTTDALSRCAELEAALDTRIERFSAEQKRHLAIQSVADIDAKAHVDAVRAASVKLAGAAEPLLREKLEVLQSSGGFVEKLRDEKEVQCPACGQLIPVETFQAHVKAERLRLQENDETFKTWKAAIGTLCDSVTSLKSNLGKGEVKFWRDDLTKGPLAGNFAHLDELNAEALRVSCGEEDLKGIEGKLLPLIDAAESASKAVPPNVQQFSTDTQTIEAVKAVIAAREQAAAVARAEALVSFINSLERGIRQEIRLRSERVIKEISEDIQVMWGILHPGEAIEDVRLALPKDADKAIDICLKFHGVEQDSPRLTLSEGYRNSLGLCIFLAMAKREAKKDRPLFLDDVVVSLDRNHRGMIVEVLEKEFAAQQVIILTHDREWYAELRHQLDGKGWTFKALFPYEAPDIGIRWSDSATTFDDARAQLPQRPDSAGNDARKIMDVELALIAERLQIRMPYLRSDKNDKRMAHDFLERFVADGKKCFQKKAGKDYVCHTEATGALEKADRLLVSWANRASHTFDVVRPEATKLIEVCEKALEMFKCSSCDKGVWFADAEGSQWVQCQCGEIRWRYGKG
jgi:energy-coupling factor transporter ATP-binding protein EcfA2